MLHTIPTVIASIRNDQKRVMKDAGTYPICAKSACAESPPMLVMFPEGVAARTPEVAQSPNLATGAAARSDETSSTGTKATWLRTRTM